MTIDAPVKFPLYAKLSIILIGTLAFFYILFIGKEVLVPLVFATILAILLNPIVNYLCNKKINRIIAIIIALSLAIIFIIALMYFISSQISNFSDSMPQFKQKFSILLNEVINFISHAINVSKSKVHAWIDKARVESISNSSAVIGQTLGTISDVLILILLLPVYIFMILFYKPLLLEFISRLFQRQKHNVVAEVLVETKSLIQSYLVGLLFEAALVATLNSVGLLIIGIDYAILIGIIGALLNIIPYIGGLIAITIPMLLAIATKTPIDALWVFVVYMIVQFIDNNYFVPKIVASKVKVNALVSIIVVIIGGALWGISGMFLSIPLTAIIKVICDKVEPLKPLGFLIGDNQPDIGKEIFNFKNPIKKRKIKIAE